MPVIRKPRSLPVSKCGAVAGSVLCGICHNNRELRLRILQEQRPSDGGPIEGGFVILDPGDNRHSHSLRALLHRLTNAVEVLRILRQEHPGCLSVANTNHLTLEQWEAAPPPLVNGGSAMAVNPSGEEPVPEKEPGNAPEGEPGNAWVTPEAERPPRREEGTVSDPDRSAAELPAPGAANPPHPKVQTVSSPDF